MVSQSALVKPMLIQKYTCVRSQQLTVQKEEKRPRAGPWNHEHTGEVDCVSASEILSTPYQQVIMHLSLRQHLQLGRRPCVLQGQIVFSPEGSLFTLQTIERAPARKLSMIQGNGCAQAVYPTQETVEQYKRQASGNARVQVHWDGS